MTSLNAGRNLLGLLVGCAALAACGGGTSSDSGGKASNVPLVLNLSATPNPAWLNGPVTFSVTCISASKDNSKLTYVWNFAGQSETTTAPTDVHNFTSIGSGTNGSDTYQYSVSCEDASFSPPVSTPSSTGTLKVWQTDLSTVRSNVCSSGTQGFGWCWQNPLPTGSNLRGVAAVSDLVGWTVGDSGTILETDDGGNHWQVKYLGSVIASGAVPPDLLAIQAADQNHALMVGTDGTVFATTDSGATWTATMPETSGSTPFTLTSAFITDTNHLWGINNQSSIVQSSDGSTWTTATIKNSDGSSADPTTRLSAIAASDSKTAFAVGSITPVLNNPSDTIPIYLQTVNGSAWTAQTVSAAPIGTAVLESVSVPTKSKCTPLAAPDTALDIWLGGDYLGLLDNHSGPPPQPTGFFTRLASASSTLTWTQSATEYFAPPTGGPVIAGFDQSTAWAAQPEAPHPNNFDTNISALDSCGFSYSSTTFCQPIVYTTGGINGPWTSSAKFESPLLNAIDSNDCEHGWAVGKSGAIWRTASSASTWTAQSSGPQISEAAAGSAVGAAGLISVSASTSRVAFALGMDVAPSVSDQGSAVMRIFGTTDGGVTWNALTNARTLDWEGPGLPSPSYGQIATNPAGYVVAVGVGYVTTDSPGAPWSGTNVASSFASFGQPLWTSVSISTDSAWVIDGAGNVALWVIPTNTWSVVSLPVDAAPAPPVGVGPPAGAGIAALSSSTALIVGGATIFQTNNGGQNWTVVPTSQPINSALNAISVSNLDSSNTVGWAVGDNGTIRHLTTLDRGQTWTVETQSASGFSINGLAVDPANVKYVAVSTADAKNAWAVGEVAFQHIPDEIFACDILGNSPLAGVTCEAVVIHTTDGGKTWTQQNAGTHDLSAVGAVNANTAWLVGAGGRILKTVTAGAPSQ